MEEKRMFIADIVKPHDKFFKETFADVETAKDFMKKYLPQEIVECIDIENLVVEKELEESFSDLLFKTKIGETETYVYLLFEHKSYPDKRAALQLLKYMVKIWEQKVNKGKSENLPAILPMLVYHGKNT